MANLNNPSNQSLSEHAADNAKASGDAIALISTTTAVLATDIGWIKGSLKNIEITLNDMSKSFVTSAQHEEVCKRQDDHETRLNGLETSNTRQIVLISIGCGILTLLVSLLIYHLVG